MTFILYFAQLALSLHSDFGRSVDLSPSFGKIIKRLLIIRMFEKLGGGKDNPMRIIVTFTLCVDASLHLLD